VKALAADATNILAGGSFTQINGRSKRHLAPISPTGSLLTFKGHTNKAVGHGRGLLSAAAADAATAAAAGGRAALRSAGA
jgi:hypothetical protein